MEQAISDMKKAILNKCGGNLSMKILTAISSLFLYATPKPTKPVQIMRYLANSSVQGMEINRTYLATMPTITTIVMAVNRMTNATFKLRSKESKNFFMDAPILTEVSPGAGV